MDAALVETHVSVVFFVGDHAYKLKKPVRFDFVDLTSRSAREAICHREVELNRRLAPDVYDGVADILGPDGQPCDHLVIMRRMPPERRLSTLVAQHDARVDRGIDDIAGQLARFHATAMRSALIDAYGSRDAVRGLWRSNFDQLRDAAGSILPGDELERVAALAEAYLRGREALFERRIGDGHIVDGHGDLLADDIYLLDDGPRLLDCLEFADPLRYGDVVADVAFLAMDLERLGAPGLATQLVGAYERASGTAIPTSLLDHYIAYRAQVRTLIACLRASQAGSTAGDAAASAQTQLQLCAAHLARASVRLVLVGGLPGTGKSTLAHHLGERLGWPVLRSDVLRKELAGIDPDGAAASSYGSGIYTDEHTERTYDELLRRARDRLAMGESVIVDATWTAGRHREAARELARTADAGLVELACALPSGQAAERIRARALAGHDASDADAAVAAAMAASADPWPGAVVIDTSGPPDGASGHALAVIEASRRSGVAPARS